MRLRIDKSKFVQERFGARFLFILDLQLLLANLFVTPEPQPRIMIYCTSSRMFFYLVAWIFSKLRRRDSFYVAGFYEMDEKTYWWFVSYVMFAMKFLFLRGYVSLSPLFQYIDYAITTHFLIITLMNFQSRDWLSETEQQRQEQLRKLQRKANLSSKELEVVKPTLLQVAAQGQKVPFTWWATLLLISIITGSALNVYSTVVVDYLERIGFAFPNLLPPY